MMILISLLALGLLSLSTVTLRTSSQSELEWQAKQNARLGMLLALGELQRTMGPDQRVSATSSQRDPSGNRQHLTGVWEGWKWNGQGSTPDWQQKKKDLFKGWLVSSADPTLAQQTDFPASPVAGNKAQLVSTAPGETSPVEAGIVGLPAPGQKRSAGYAWAVFDQAEKTAMTLPANRGSGIDTRLDRMAAAPKPGYQAVSSLDWTTLANREEDRQKLVSLNQTALVQMPANARSFHDLASHTEGLVVDVANGGFSKDLSRLFDSDTLPSDYASRFLYSDSSTPLAAAATRFKGANPLPSPDPSWKLLQSHYRAYTRMTASGSAMETVADARPAAGTAALNDTTQPAFNRQQIFPVIAKAQFVFSISFGYHPTIEGMYTSGSAKSAPTDQRDKYLTWMVIDPVITLWNPYNVPIRFTGGRIDLYRVPLAFRLYKNGTVVNPNYTELANMFLDTDFGARANKYYRLNLLPETGKTDLIMAPGEHIVMTAHTHVQHFNQVPTPPSASISAPASSRPPVPAATRKSAVPPP
ncbi:MAG: hypothetical protein QM755_02305 [Luteolibacter sp.]